MLRRTLTALLLLAAAVAGAPAAAQTPGEPQTVTGLSEPVYDASVVEVYEVPTDHGTLYGEVVRPVVPDGVTVPVILTLSPYNVLGAPLPGTSIAEDAMADFYVPRGYARAVFDVIGTRNSGGCYDYGGIGERETGAALVDFLGTQPWSNGRVGMIGGSYDGTTAIATAVQAPEHLTTIVPQVAIDRWYDYAYGQGVRYFLNNEEPTDEGFDTPLAFDFGFGLMPPGSTGGSPEVLAEAVEGRINPCERILHTQRGYDPDPVYDEFWVERDYRALAGNVRASVLIEGGWLDHNVKHWDSTRFFLALPEDHPKRLVMGQWNHSASQFEDAADLRHAWFDFWLLGLPTGVMDLPPVDTEPGGAGARTQEASWPPAGTVTAELALVPGAEGTEPATGELALVGAADPAFAETAPPTSEAEILGSRASERSTYVHLVTAPLADDVRVSGSPLLDLVATTDAESTHLTPVLYEETPDGTLHVITRGFLNSRNRGGLDTSEPLVPGEPYGAPVELWDTDYVVAAGSRLGVAIAAGNAEWAVPEDDGSAATLLSLAESRLLLPVSAGQEAVGAQLPDTGADVEVVRLGGADRVATAAAVSQHAFASADTLVVARADAYPDALAGAPLATHLDAPLLLTSGDALSAPAAEEVARLGAADAVLLGGTAALSERVAEDLEDLGLQVRRVAGPDRFATAAAVAAELPAGATAYLVEGANTDPARGWPDAVSAAPVAAFTGAPVLLATRDTLPAATADALADRAVTETVVVGGPAAVSDTVLEELAEAGHGPRRVAGATRYATSAAVHAEAVAAGMDAGVAWLATGRDWPDALAGGAAVGHAGATLLLVDGRDLDGSSETRDLLAATAPRSIRLLGGEAAISATTAAAITDLIS